MTAKLKPFCHACQAIPAAGYCNLAGCPIAPAKASPVGAEVPIDWETVAEARAETLKDLAARYSLYSLAISSAIDILANRGRFGSPDDALDHLRRAQSATQSEADGDYPFWVKELADEQANGLRMLAALKRVYFEWDGEPEDMIHVQDAIALAERRAPAEARQAGWHLTFDELEDLHSAVAGVTTANERAVPDEEYRWEQLALWLTRLAVACNERFPANWKGLPAAPAEARAESSDNPIGPFQRHQCACGHEWSAPVWPDQVCPACDATVSSEQAEPEDDPRADNSWIAPNGRDCPVDGGVFVDLRFDEPVYEDGRTVFIGERAGDWIWDDAYACPPITGWRLHAPAEARSASPLGEG